MSDTDTTPQASVYPPPAAIPMTEQLLMASQRKRRALLSEGQVNAIREAYHLDGKSITWIKRNLEPTYSTDHIRSIARGEAYRTVPLSTRLRMYYERRRGA